MVKNAIEHECDVELSLGINGSSRSRRPPVRKREIERATEEGDEGR